jgi:hypothetical protein
MTDRPLKLEGAGPRRRPGPSGARRRARGCLAGSRVAGSGVVGSGVVGSRVAGSGVAGSGVVGSRLAGRGLGGAHPAAGRLAGRALRRLAAVMLLGVVLLAVAPPVPSRADTPASQASPATGGSLEAAASRAGDTGRKIGLSLIGLALAVAAVILVFKRDFKEAVGVVAIGIVAILLVSPAGISVLQDTVSMLFGSS